MTRRCEFYIFVVCFVSRVCIPHAQRRLATVTAATSTCLVPDLRWVLFACCKSLFSLLVVSQLVTESAPLDSECLEEKIEILPKTETVEEKVTEVTVGKVAWPWRRFIWELVDREDVLP